MHISLGHAGIVDHSIDSSTPDLKKSIKKEWTEAIKKKFKRKTMPTRERRHTIVGPSLISWTHLQGIVLIA